MDLTETGDINKVPRIHRILLYRIQNIPGKNTQKNYAKKIFMTQVTMMV